MSELCVNLGNTPKGIVLGQRVDIGDGLTGTVVGTASWMEQLNCGTHVRPGTPGHAVMEHGYVVQLDEYHGLDGPLTASGPRSVSVNTLLVHSDNLTPVDGPRPDDEEMVQAERHGHVWPCPGFWQVDSPCVCHLLAGHGSPRCRCGNPVDLPNGSCDECENAAYNGDSFGRW